MTDEHSTRDDHERQLDAIIAAYYRAVDAGECVDQKDFIAKHPEVQKKLSEFFPDIRVFARKECRDNLNHALEATIVSQAAQSMKSGAGPVLNHHSGRWTKMVSPPQQ